jgi:uncharacterized membrane protein (DUF485 family)
MVLNSKSWLVRWAYSLYGPAPDKRYGPVSTTLCAFFWRAFFFVPLTWALIVSMICFILYMMYEEPIMAAAIVAAVISVLIIQIVGGFIVDWLDYRRWKKFDAPYTEVEAGPSAIDVFFDGIETLKSKFCPIIYFKL